MAGSSSFEAFFHDEARTLFRRLCTVTGNSSEAEEIMQDAFLALWERWDRIAGMDDPTGYLYRTVNVFRKRTRRAALAIRRTFASAPDPTPFSEIDAQQDLLTALAELSPRQRAALVLTDVLDYSSEEAGRLLGVTAGTVRGSRPGSGSASSAGGGPGMSDERLLLEWVGERFTFPEDAFDRLLRRRNRKVRNQRIASGLLAVIVSLLAIAGLLRAFADRRRATGRSTPSRVRQGRWRTRTTVCRGSRAGGTWVTPGRSTTSTPILEPTRALPRDRGTDGHPVADRPGEHLADRVSGPGRLSRLPHFRTSTASGCVSTGAPSSTLAGCRSGTHRDGLSGSGSRSFPGRVEAP